MTAIAFALVMIGIGALIEGYHGHTIWTAMLDFFSGQKASN